MQSSTPNQAISSDNPSSHLPSPPSSDEKHKAQRSAFPQATTILACFRAIQAGCEREAGPCIEFLCSYSEYDELQRLLDDDLELGPFVHHKIRYDYDGQSLIIRMPHPLHERVLHMVSKNIEDQLAALAISADNGIRGFAGAIEFQASEDIHFPTSDESNRLDSKPRRALHHSPDGAFCHEDAQWPGVILEMGYSQTSKDIKKLAHKYIKDSLAGVCAVVGINIEYVRKKADQDAVRKATFSIWRAQVEEDDSGIIIDARQDVKDQAFRDVHGNPVPGPGLQLELSDFACSDLTAVIEGKDQTITISPETVCAYLNRTETRVRKKEANSLIKPEHKGLVRKRRRSSTEEEELHPNGSPERYKWRKTRTRGLAAREEHVGDEDDLGGE